MASGNGKVMLITGTRKGIGKALAEYYASFGYSVIGCSRESIDFELGNYEHFIADVSDEASVKRIFSYIRKKFGRLDVLLNNAGIASMNHSMLTPISVVTGILNTNFTGTFLFSREAAKLMQKNRYGRIVNFSTVAVPLKLDGEAVYAASKAAINSLTQIMARELAEFGITVNAIGPTPIETDLIKAVPKGKIEALLLRQAIPRFGETTDIINVVDFYIKPESSFITGQIIYLGGV
jgi:3-oxoacyl-[acyl-carrier protein] reductase